VVSIETTQIFEFLNLNNLNILYEWEVSRFSGAILLLILGGILAVVFHSPSGIG
jgi:hypothetical protein